MAMIDYVADKIAPTTIREAKQKRLLKFISAHQYKDRNHGGGTLQPPPYNWWLAIKFYRQHERYTNLCRAGRDEKRSIPMKLFRSV